MAGQKSEKSFWEKIDVAHRKPRLIYVLTVIAIALPLVRPLGIPLEVTYETKLTYDYIEKLPAGAKIVFATYATSTNLPTMGAVEKAMFLHLIQKNVKIMILSFAIEDSLIFDKYLKPALPLTGYGENWVLMPYTPLSAVVQALIGSDTWRAIPFDYYGAPVETLPIMQYYKTARDWDLLLCSGTNVLDYMRQWQVPYGVPIIFNSASMHWSSFRIYLDTGQFVGMTNGARGGAEYELLLKRPGTLIAVMDSTSLTFLLDLIFIIFGNIVFFGSRKMVRKEAKK